MQVGETGAGGVELVAMGPGQAAHSSGFEHPVEEAAGPAVGVSDEDVPVAPLSSVEARLDRAPG